MFDDSICYLLHDMRGYNYNIANNPAEVAGSNFLAEETNWLANIFQSETTWELWDWLSSGLYDTNVTANILNSEVTGDMRPHRFIDATLCREEGHDHSEQLVASDVESFGYGTFMSMDFGGGLKVRFNMINWPYDWLADFLSEQWGEVNVDAIRSCMEPRLTDITSPQSAISSLLTTTDFVFKAFFANQEMLISPEDSTWNFLVPRGVQVSHSLGEEGFIERSSNCFAEPREISVNFSRLTRGSQGPIRLQPFIQIGLCFSYEGLYTQRLVTVRQLRQALGIALGPRLNAAYDYLVARDRTSVTTNLFVDAISVPGQHNVRDCSICQEREEFNLQECVDTIQALA